MNNKHTLAAFSFVWLVAIAMVSGTANAMTPDGETPANEGVCDGLQAATPGLYGLCVAYCEAQDLDTVDKNPPSTKILANYDKKKQAGDPDMPCIQTPCPCFSTEELDAAVSDGVVSACINSGETIQMVDNAPKLRFFRSNQTGRCAYVDFNNVLPAPPTVRNLNITGDEALSCHAQITAACASTGN